MGAIKGLFRVFMGWMLLACCTVAEAQVDEEQLKRFQLFAECQPIGVTVSVFMNDDTGEMVRQHKQEEVIHVTLESRLRAARLYRTQAQNTLSVGVFAPISAAFVAIVQYSKILYDPITQQLNKSTTWVHVGYGPSSDMHTFFSQTIDSFLVDYLRVNEPACRER